MSSNFLDKNFPSKYFKAADVAKPLHLKIQDVGEEAMRDGTSKPILFFRDELKGLVLNKTNAVTLVDAFGGNEVDWAGKQVTLVSETVTFGGKRVDAIRVQIPDPVLDADTPF